MKKAEIQYQERTAGWLLQDEEGYHFMYDVAYLASENPKAISVTLPLKATAYTSKTLPFRHTVHYHFATIYNPVSLSPTRVVPRNIGIISCTIPSSSAQNGNFRYKNEYGQDPEH